MKKRLLNRLPLLCLLVAFFTSCLWSPESAAELTTRAEILERMLRQGRVEAARTGFKEQIESDLERLEDLLDNPKTTEKQVIAALGGLDWIATEVEMWESAEVDRQSRGASIPDTVRQQVFDLADRLEALLRRFRAELQETEKDSEQTKERLELTSHRVSRALTKTVVFVEGALSEARRKALLKKANELTGSQQSLAQLPDLRAAFFEKREYSGTGQFGPGASPARIVSREEDAELFSFIESFYHALFGDDVRAVESFLDPRTREETDVGEVMRELRGAQLVKLDQLVVRESEDGRMSVSVGILVYREPSGREVRSGDELILRRRDGGYVVLSF